jgi:hypothetical protein
MRTTSSKIVIAATLIILVIAAFIFLRSIFKEDDETETFYCGANKTLPVKVLKNPTKAFPSFAKEFTSKMSGSMEIMDSVANNPEIKGSVELSSKIIELRDKLNQESSRMEMIMKSNFLAYNSKPCDEQISKQYFDLLKLVAEKNADLERLRAELTRPISKGGDTTHVTIEKDTGRIHSAINRFSENYTFENK